MKVIDLLNRIANGEEVPDNIEYENEIYYFSNDNKAYYNSKTHHILECIILKSSLNDEIIEEDKKIEKFEFREIEDREHYEIKQKINEIIDYINGGTNE